MGSNSENKIVILDGGFSWQLSRHIKRKIDDDVLWGARYLVTDPESIIETHLDFLRAGSDVIETNTYQASVVGFMEHMGLSEEDSHGVIKNAVKLAKTACNKYFEEHPDEKNRKILIVGSVGPYGASLHDGSEYTGSYIQSTSVETMNRYHRSKISALLEGGVDLLALETIPCRAEAEVLVNLLKNEFPNVKAWLSFSCKDEMSISHGENFQETARYCYDLNPQQLVAVGVNCTNPAFCESLFTGINAGRESNPIPLLAYPNSGEKYASDKGWTERENCLSIESYVPKWLDLGITWIGGCCRVYDTEISAIRKAVEEWKSKKLK